MVAGLVWGCQIEAGLKNQFSSNPAPTTGRNTRQPRDRYASTAHGGVLRMEMMMMMMGVMQQSFRDPDEIGFVN